MNVILPKRMTVEEYLDWAEGRPGRTELIDGVVCRMSPERALHAECKAAAFICLKAAIKASGLPYFAMPDGMTVRITPNTAYEPDALVYRGPRMAAKDLEVPRIAVVVEVLSPGTRNYDTSGKLAGYFSVPSLEHYLIVDADERTVIHHRRGPDEGLATAIHREGVIALDPPGLCVTVSDLLPEP